MELSRSASTTDRRPGWPPKASSSAERATTTQAGVEPATDPTATAPTTPSWTATPGHSTVRGLTIQRDTTALQGAVRRIQGIALHHLIATRGEVRIKTRRKRRNRDRDRGRLHRRGALAVGHHLDRDLEAAAVPRAHPRRGTRVQRARRNPGD